MEETGHECRFERLVLKIQDGSVTSVELRDAAGSDILAAMQRAAVDHDLGSKQAANTSTFVEKENSIGEALHFICDLQGNELVCCP